MYSTTLLERYDTDTVTGLWLMRRTRSDFRGPAITVFFFLWKSRIKIWASIMNCLPSPETKFCSCIIDCGPFGLVSTGYLQTSSIFLVWELQLFLDHASTEIVYISGLGFGVNQIYNPCNSKHTPSWRKLVSTHGARWVCCLFLKIEITNVWSFLHKRSFFIH